MDRKIDSFMVEFAEEHQVSEKILTQIYDVMNRYKGKQKSGEKITGEDFLTDMNLASYLNEDQIAQLVNGMKSHEEWGQVGSVLADKMES